MSSLVALNDIEESDSDNVASRRLEDLLQKHRSLRIYTIVASVLTFIAFGFAIFVFIRELQQQKVEKQRVERYLKATDRFAQVLADKEVALLRAHTLVEQQSRDVSDIRNDTKKLLTAVNELKSTVDQLSGSSSSRNRSAMLLPNVTSAQNATANVRASSYNFV